MFVELGPYLSVFMAILFLTLILVGFIVPITAIITYAFYHIRMKYNFTWEKDMVEKEKEATAQA